MSEEQKPKSAAEQIRDTARNGHDVLLKLLKEIEVVSIPTDKGSQLCAACCRIAKVQTMAILWQGAIMSEIAAQLADRNSRDTAAEARVKDMKESFEAVMASIASGGIVTPQGAPAIDPSKLKRGK